jgi:hypothetical protein
LDTALLYEPERKDTGRVQIEQECYDCFGFVKKELPVAFPARRNRQSENNGSGQAIAVSIFKIQYQATASHF